MNVKAFEKALDIAQAFYWVSDDPEYIKKSKEYIEKENYKDNDPDITAKYVAVICSRCSYY